MPHPDPHPQTITLDLDNYIAPGNYHTIPLWTPHPKPPKSTPSAIFAHILKRANPGPTLTRLWYPIFASVASVEIDLPGGPMYHYGVWKFLELKQILTQAACQVTQMAQAYFLWMTSPVELGRGFFKTFITHKANWVYYFDVLHQDAFAEVDACFVDDEIITARRIVFRFLLRLSKLVLTMSHHSLEVSWHTFALDSLLQHAPFYNYQTLYSGWGLTFEEEAYKNKRDEHLYL